jgi:hypothetical protein
MTNPTSNFGWQMPTSADLVTDLPADFEVFGQAVDTSLADLKGGTTGQVLSKASNTNMDFAWVTDATGIPATIFDAKGDLIAATAADTASRLAVGSNGQVLTADSTEATGVKWATPAGGGKVLQVVSTTYSTATSITSTSFTDSGLSLSITPTSNTSKVLVLVTQPTYLSGTDSGGSVRLVRGSTTVWTTGNDGYEGIYYQGGTAFGQLRVLQNISYLDSPATTSATTYKTQGRLYFSGTLGFQNSSATSTITLLEIGA